MTQTAAHPFDAAAPDRVRAAVRDVMASYTLPGFSIAVVTADEVLYSESFGVADIESSTPMTQERRHRIASVSKTMVGLALMALCDEGRLSLDARVMELLPDVRFVGPAQTMTVRDLLRHTSGIGEAPTLAALAASVDPSRPEEGRPRPFAESYPDGIVVEAVPGTKWAYCNNGYALLGEILCRTEGGTLNDVLQRRIFRPLGMKDSDALDEQLSSLTTGYHRKTTDDAAELLRRAGREPKDGEPVDGVNIRGKPRPEFNLAMLAAGGVQSTLPDMARYAQALLRGGDGIVRPDTFEAMIAPSWCPDARLMSWGLSFARAQRFGKRSFGHGGAYFGGWNTNLVVFPDDGIGVVQQMNVMLDQPAPVFTRVLRAVMHAPEPALPEPRAADQAILESAPGVYEATPGPLTNFRPVLRFGRLQIAREGDALWVYSRRGPWKAGARMYPTDDPALFAVPTSDDAAPEQVLLTRDGKGNVDGVRWGEFYHMLKTDTTAPWITGSMKAEEA